MNSDHNLSGWPLVLSWGGNVFVWMIGPSMSPLQVIALVLTIAYTALKLWRLYHDRGAKE